VVVDAVPSCRYAFNLLACCWRCFQDFTILFALWILITSPTYLNHLQHF
jgi:hypothetical protein